MNSLMLFLIDASGSMQYTRDEAASAFNHFLAMQQLRRDDCLLYGGQFNDYFTEVYPFVSIFEAQPLVAGQNYYPGGGTDLWLALSTMLDKVDRHLAKLPDDQQPTNVTLMIQSDGGTEYQDGASDRRSDVMRDKGGDIISAGWNSYLKARIKKARADGWNIIFLAENTNSDVTIHTLGVRPEHTVYYLSDIEGAFEAAAEALLESVITGQVGSLKGGV